jgi:hypothetical protein
MASSGKTGLTINSKTGSIDSVETGLTSTGKTGLTTNLKTGLIASVETGLTSSGKTGLTSSWKKGSTSSRKMGCPDNLKTGLRKIPAGTRKTSIDAFDRFVGGRLPPFRFRRLRGKPDIRSGQRIKSRSHFSDR